MRPTWTPNAPKRVPWRPPSDPWAPKAVLGCFLGSFWTPKIVKNGAEICQKKQASIWRYLFGYLEASGGRLELDLGVILGSILGSRTRHAIFAKNSTAPQREHDF